ncbi:RagB/SusD family nutrient uptake outer membrane protein [Pedobacter sp. BS3]|nr:RagB/SusD family nutrient uptake outer membrane protein [Pedobacter sp. BS3]
MKRYSKLILAVMAGILVSCQKLDIKPTNVVTEDVVFNGEAGMNVYMANIYRKLPIEDFRYRPGGEGRAGMNLHHEWQNFFHMGAAIGEMVGPFGDTYEITSGFGYWPYDDIRAVNYVLENLPKYSANFTGNRVNELLGEAYFCRAFFYFALVKRYGGVPIVTTVQNYPQQSIEELQMHRDKEEDVWNFIGEDLDKAYEMMPEKSPRGRANKYVALALKSRAMLYAGSIAKYGSVNYVDGDARAQGLVGIPAESANGFFTKAWEAASLLEGKYELYNQTPGDKVKNYVDAFLDPASKENILVRDYSKLPNLESAHSWDATFSPGYMTVGPESRAYPTLEFVERWGKLPIVDANDYPIKYDNLADLMNGLEPRLLATVYFPGATLRGYTFDTQRGLYENMFTGTATQEVAKPLDSRASITASDPNTLYNGRRIIGQAGMKRPGSPDNATRTGFFVRKYIDYNKDKSQTGLFQSEQAWIEFRYGEILLNRAEAAMELSNPGDALYCINQLRERAGGPHLNSITLDDVRNERCKELAFENHYYWDLKRWRIADVVLDNAKFKGLMPYYIISENKYIFLAERETFDRTYTFEKKFYYEAIPGGELAKNPNLYPNNPNY